MITYWLLQLAVHLLGAVVGVIPLPGPPDWLTSHTGAISHVFAAAGHLGAWYPAQLVLTVILFLAGVWALAFGIKAARMVLSLFTGGGGSAA